MEIVTPSTVADVLAAARRRPLQFFNAMWPNGEPWQQAAVQMVWRWPRSSIVSANGAGKTWDVARIIITHLLSHAGSIVVSTAGTWVQVRRQVWGEISEAHLALPKWLQLAKLNETDWKLAGKWYAIGLSTDRVEHFEGFHSPNTLVVVDEAKTMTQGTLDACNRIFSGRGDPRLLMVSSAGDPKGPHYDSFHDHVGQYARLKVSPFECWLSGPGDEEGRYILPPTKALTPEYIQQMRDLYGETSPQYQSIVCADWCEDVSAWCLFPPAVLRDMKDVVRCPKHVKKIIWVGADVARSVSGDESAFKAVEEWTDPEDGRVHDAEIGAEQFRTADSNEYADNLVTFCVEHGAQAENVNVDATGIGGPVCDILKSRGWKVNPVVFSEKADVEVPKLANKKAQLYWDGHTMARERRLHNVRDDWTLSQLSEPRYAYNSRGEIQIESKEAVAKRISQSRPRSPWKSQDRGEALLLALHRPFRQPPGVSLCDMDGFY